MSKEKMKQNCKVKTTVHLKVVHITITLDLSLATLKARKAWNHLLQAMKLSNHKSRVLSFENQWRVKDIKR